MICCTNGVAAHYYNAVYMFSCIQQVFKTTSKAFAVGWWQKIGKPLVYSTLYGGLLNWTSFASLIMCVKVRISNHPPLFLILHQTEFSP